MSTGFPEHQRWMDHAMALANRALPVDVPVGAVLTDELGNILGEGWNSREQAHDPAGHAEMMAIKAACAHRQSWRLNKCILYVTLEPCPMCASALLQAHIGTIVFGAYDPIQGALGSACNLPPLYNSSVRVVGGIFEAQCKEQLQDFFRAKR